LGNEDGGFEPVFFYQSDQVDKLAVVGWFGKIGITAHFVGCQDVVGRGGRGKNDDGNVFEGFAGLYFPERFMSVHPGHIQIEEDDTGTGSILGKGLEKLFAIGRELYILFIYAHLGERIEKEHFVVIIIISDEDGYFIQIHWPKKCGLASEI